MIKIGDVFNNAASTITKSHAANVIFGNPLYISALLIVIIMIILYITTEDEDLLKIGFWISVSVTLTILLYNYSRDNNRHSDLSAFIDNN